MIDKLSDDMKKLFLLGIGAAAVTAEKARDMVDHLVEKGELSIEQGKVLNEELKFRPAWMKRRASGQPSAWSS